MWRRSPTCGKEKLRKNARGRSRLAGGSLEQGFGRSGVGAVGQNFLVRLKTPGGVRQKAAGSCWATGLDWLFVDEIKNSHDRKKTV